MGELRPIAVDLGQGGCRVRIASANDVDTRIYERGFWAVEDPFEHVSQAIISALGGRVETPVRIVIGMTGFEEKSPSIETMRCRLASEGISGELVVCSDSVTAYFGALGPVSGAVVAAGTGAVALGVNLEGVSGRSDGWGAFLGDRGSGYWIGHQAVRAAIQCVDRQQPSDLIGVVLDRWGSIAELSRRWRDPALTPDEVASIALPVAEVARAGDKMARVIWARAGEMLGDSVADVILATGLDEVAVPFAGTGALFEASDLLVTDFTVAVGAKCPNAQATTPQGDPLHGAMAMASMSELPQIFRSLVTRKTLIKRN